MVSALGVVVVGLLLRAGGGRAEETTTSAAGAAGAAGAARTSAPLNGTTEGKPSKFDETIEDKVYVDLPSRTSPQTTSSPTSSTTALALLHNSLTTSSLALDKKGKHRGKRSSYRLQPPPLHQHRRLVRWPGGGGGVRGWYGVGDYGPRSPRLVFRDPVEPGTLQAPWAHNSIQENPEDSNRGRGECGLGSCQSLLTCWLSWGRVAGSCPGFLQVCCDLSAGKSTSASSASQDQTTDPPATDYGPVVNDPRCGVSVKQGAQRRIVGGDEAGFGSFPWQAYIRIGSSRCGGSLVNRYHVVTAGHCVARAQARQVQVTLGDYVINSAVEPLPAYTYGVRQISVHPYFKFTPQADRFDVAVLRLDRPVQYMAHIAPICLPTKGQDFLGQFGWAAGWGALQPGELAAAAEDPPGRGRPRDRQQDVREMAPQQRHQCRHLRRDDVRRLQGRRQGLLPGRLRRAADAGEDGEVVPDRDRLCGLLLRAAGSARHLPQSRPHRRLDLPRHQLVAGVLGTGNYYRGRKRRTEASGFGRRERPIKK